MTNIISEPTDDFNPDFPEDSDNVGHFEATEKPDNDGMDFHVQMKGYTLTDFEDRVVQAAAVQLLGKRNERNLAKLIEDKAIELLNEKITEALEPVTAEIINKPLLPENLWSKESSENPVTMREYIGLCGRDFLESSVDKYSGKPAKNNGFYSDGMQRLEYLVQSHLNNKFKQEIDAEVHKAVREVENSVKARMNDFVKEQKDKFLKALGAL